MKHCFFSIVVLALLAARVNATVGVQLGAGNLYESNGVSLVQQDRMALLVVDTGSNGFSFVEANAPLTLNSFIAGDDRIAAVWDFSSPGVDGSLNNLATFTFAGGISVNDPIALYWFPTLTTNSTTAIAGTPYGTYTDAAGIDGSARWFMPADNSGDFTLLFLTQDQGGSNLESAGRASLQVIPEPSTWTLAIAGISALAIYRRSKK